MKPLSDCNHNIDEMEIVKVDRKWRINGGGEGWVFDRTFPMKWKAEIALEVFQEGGRVSDYWNKARKRDLERPERVPWRVLAKLQKAVEEIKSLNPTCDEIKEYGEFGLNTYSGVVTISQNDMYYPPKIHNTWGLKRGGRVHIDIGCDGYHLMLNKDYARDFIEFIESKRK
jgi:hypothetical protein